MKFTIIAFAACLTYASSTKAAEITDLIGSWAGTRSEFVGGQKVTAKQTTKFRRFQSGGIKGTSKIFIPNAGTVTALGTYYASGKYEAIGYFRGQVLSISTGRWRFVNSTLSVTGTTRDITGSYRAKASFRLVGKRSFAFVSTLSNGVKITGTFRKK